MSFVETGMTGDTRSAPINVFRGPYTGSGRVRFDNGGAGSTMNVGNDYLIPEMAAYDVLSFHDCGNWKLGGNRPGQCDDWTAACAKSWEKLMDNALGLVQQLTVAAEGEEGTLEFMGHSYAMPIEPCTIQTIFAVCMDTINRAVGSFDPQTGLYWPEPGDPNYVDRRMSSIFGGESNHSGLWPAHHGGLAPYAEQAWNHPDPSIAIMAFDPTYSAVTQSGFGSVGGGKAKWGTGTDARYVYAAEPARGDDGDRNATWRRSTNNEVIKLGTASFCRHRMPATYGASGATAMWGEKVSHGGEKVYPLEYIDHYFAELRQAAVAAMARYQERWPDVQAAGGVVEACAAEIALVSQDAASVAATQDVAQAVGLQNDIADANREVRHAEGKEKLAKTLALAGMIDAEANQALFDAMASQGAPPAAPKANPLALAAGAAALGGIGWFLYKRWRG